MFIFSRVSLYLDFLYMFIVFIMTKTSFYQFINMVLKINNAKVNLCLILFHMCVTHICVGTQRDSLLPFSFIAVVVTILSFVVSSKY